MSKLNGKAAIVTGGSKGIGAGISTLWVWGRNAMIFSACANALTTSPSFNSETLDPCPLIVFAVYIRRSYKR